MDDIGVVENGDGWPGYRPWNPTSLIGLSVDVHKLLELKMENGLIKVAYGTGWEVD